MIRTSFAMLAGGLMLGATLGASAASPAQTDPARTSRQAADLSHGEQLFLGCVSCHGSDGEGQPSGDTPAIAGQHRSTVIRQLNDFRRGMRWDVRMEAVASQHRLPHPQDIQDIAAFVSSLPVQPTGDHGDGAGLAQGELVYAGLCASCHGQSAAGSDRAVVPRLAGQSYRYLLRQMYNTVDHRRPNLTATHESLFRSLTQQEVQDTADYLSRLR